MTMSVSYTNINGQIVHENRGGTESFYAPDTLGSTALLLSPSGVVTDTFTYQPYGEIVSHVGVSVTPFTYVGTLGYYLEVLGSLIYVRMRHFRQGLARWQTVDPFWPSKGAYGYVDDNPMALSDPTGAVPTFDPPWLNGPIGAKARKCLSNALKNSPQCKGLTPAQLGALYIEMICIMGCETSAPPAAANNPMNPDDPKHPGSGGQGPCRLTPGWKPVYQSDWRHNLCDNIASGVNLLCYYVQNPGLFGGSGQPRFPWYQDQDNGCLGRCLNQKSPGGMRFG